MQSASRETELMEMWGQRPGSVAFIGDGDWWMRFWVGDSGEEGGTLALKWQHKRGQLWKVSYVGEKAATFWDGVKTKLRTEK